MSNLDEISVPVNNLEVVCRLCLAMNEKLFNLFRPEEIETSAITLSMKASLCTSIRMSKQDILPQKICKNCLDYINEWYKFRRKCIRNDWMLKKCLSASLGQQKIVENGKVDEGYSDVNFQNSDKDGITSQQTEAADVTNVGESTKEVKLNMPNSDECFDDEVDAKITAAELIKKSLVKSPKKKFKCALCPDSFYYLKDLKVHRSMIHKLDKPVISDDVPMKEDDVKLEKVSVKTRYEMKCCDNVFFSKASFRKHFSKKHPGEKPFMCETCGKKDFISEETLKRHKMLHTGKYRCDVCSKTFTCNAILIIHKRDKHEDDKPFICDVCGKRFVTELLMNYHKRFHTGEKKYVCEECGLAVVTSSSLAKHKRIHSDVKPHVCQVCGKGFIIKGRLVEHLRVHTGERPYSCHICHKGFTMRDKLKRHIRIHSGEKLFSCEYCGNNYSTNYGLTVHLKSHTVRNY